MGKPIGGMRRFLKAVKLPVGTRYAILTTEAAPRPDKKTGRMPTEEELATVDIPKRFRHKHESDEPGETITLEKRSLPASKCSASTASGSRATRQDDPHRRTERNETSRGDATATERRRPLKSFTPRTP